MQCEPPGDLAVLTELRDAGADSIGIHVESLDDDVRRRWMPGKASVPLTQYRAAWREAVRVFGRNQVSTYLLVGLGEDPDELVAGLPELIEMGVYPFVVPFRPHAGTLAVDVDGVSAPRRDVVEKVVPRVAKELQLAGMRGADQKAGCAACGACSVLQSVGRVIMGDQPSSTSSSGDPRPAATRAHSHRPGFLIQPAESGRTSRRTAALRREAFVVEQGLFAEQRPRTTSTTIPARWCSCDATADGTVLGGVRLAPRRDRDLGWWTGSRLVVGDAARPAGVGPALVRAACAHAESPRRAALRRHRAAAVRADVRLTGLEAQRRRRRGGRIRTRDALADPIRSQRLADATKSFLADALAPLAPFRMASDPSGFRRRRRRSAARQRLDRGV